MKVSDFDFRLPQALIARYPTKVRSASRLLHLHVPTGEISHHRFSQLPDLLLPDDLLVFNNTRVMPARLFGRKSTGGKVEILLERVLNAHQALAQIRAGRALAPGAEIQLLAPRPTGTPITTTGTPITTTGTPITTPGHPSSATGTPITRINRPSGSLPPADNAPECGKPRISEPVVVKVMGRQGEFHLLEFPPPGPAGVAARFGQMPLPPYIGREADATDLERYQTIYAKREHEGAVAAPTAGLHFDEALFKALAARGVSRAEVTLHVGAGTFQPVRADKVEDHRMHAESFTVSADVCTAVDHCRARRGRVVAVGTTTVRCLESATSAAINGDVICTPCQGDTDIFIYPGYEFQSVDALVTNFHLPGSTLLMLVSAFAGLDNIKRAYAEAIQHAYRFFSYGDAMLMTL